MRSNIFFLIIFGLNFKSLWYYPGANYQCAYESGFCGFWIQRELQKLNIECIVVNAADVPQTDKGIKNKNDKNDSKRIAIALQSGRVEGCLSVAYAPRKSYFSSARFNLTQSEIAEFSEFRILS